MPRNFTITTPTNLARADAEGRVQVQFTVTNTSGAPQRRLFRVLPLADAKEAWLSLAGENERAFTADAVHQISVTAVVPPGTPAGRYGFRLDSISATRAGEEIEEGPAVYFDFAGTSAAKKSKGWLWILIVILLLVAAVIAWLLTRGSDAGTTEVDTTTAPTTATDVDRGFRVVETFLRADPIDHTGPCPAVITFSGRISVIGGSGTVSYRFIRSDGAEGPIETLTFEGPGSKEVSTTWTIGGGLGRNYEGWEAIKVFEPQEMESERASFRIHCFR